MTASTTVCAVLVQEVRVNVPGQEIKRLHGRACPDADRHASITCTFRAAYKSLVTAQKILEGVRVARVRNSAGTCTCREG